MSSLTENVQYIVSRMTYSVLNGTLNPTVNITVAALPPVDSCDEM